MIDARPEKIREYNTCCMKKQRNSSIKNNGRIHPKHEEIRE
jgi:hypothetical protein